MSDEGQDEQAPAPVRSRRRKALIQRAPPQLDVGDVLGKTLSLTFQNFPAFLCLSIVAYLPWVLIQQLGTDTISEYMQRLQSVMRWAVLGFRLFGALFLQGTVAYIVVERLRGGRPKISRSMQLSFGRLVPMFIIAMTLLFWVIVISLGFAIILAIFATVGRGFLPLLVIIIVLFVVILVALLCRFCASIPVTIIERRGAFDAMARSSRLTKGIRWKITGIVLFLYAVPSGLLRYFVQDAITLDNWTTIVWILTVVEVLLSIVLAVMFAVIYHDARTSSEGVDSSAIASVFD